MSDFNCFVFLGLGLCLFTITTTDAFVKQGTVKHTFQVGLIHSLIFIFNILISDCLAFEVPIPVSGFISSTNFIAEPSSPIDFLVHFDVIDLGFNKLRFISTAPLKDDGQCWYHC